MARIEYAMNTAQADEVFAANAVAMSGRDVIFDYKIYELFGSDACAWAESCMGAEDYLHLLNFQQRHRPPVHLPGYCSPLAHPHRYMGQGIGRFRP